MKILNTNYDKIASFERYYFRNKQHGEYDHHISKSTFKIKCSYLKEGQFTATIIDTEKTDYNTIIINVSKETLYTFISLLQSLLEYKGYELNWCYECDSACSIYSSGKDAWVCEDFGHLTKNRICEFAKGVILIYDNTCFAKLDSYQLFPIFKPLSKWANEFIVQIMAE